MPVAHLFHAGRALGTQLLWLVFFYLQNWLPTVLATLYFSVIFYPTAVCSTGVGWVLGVGRIGSNHKGYVSDKKRHALA